MTYFAKFPNIYYDFKIGSAGDESTLMIIKDITQNVRIRKEILSNVVLFDYYHIQDGETPEIIAEKVYGSPLYHWVIMMVNERYDYVDDFPMSAYTLEKHIDKKYGTDRNAIHHYVADDYIVDADFPGATSVSNADYEYALNDEKAKIKLIKPSLLQQILKEYDTVFTKSITPIVG
jgi:hypothetical protein